MHLGSNPTSLVGTPLPVPPLPTSAELDASVKSGLVPSAEVKYETLPVVVWLFDQPDVGWL